MVSVKALAAIALTLMIAVPILLGYGFASHQVTEDRWDPDESVNLSEQILNYQTPYTNASFTASNNTVLMQSWTFPGSGVTEYHAVTPEYRQATTSTTQFPIYETHTGYYTLTGADPTITNTAPGGGTVYRIANAGYPYDAGQMPNSFVSRSLDAFTISISTSATSPIHWEFETNFNTTFIDPSSPISFVRDGASTYSVTSSAGTTASVANWELRTDAGATITIYPERYTGLTSTESVPIGSIYSFETPTTGSMSIKLSGAAAGGGDVYIATHDQVLPVSVNGATVTVGSSSYTNVTAVNVAGVSSLYMTYLTPTGSYADPNYGWGVPAPPSAAVYRTWWMNNFSNQSVTFLMKFTNDATVYLNPTNEYNGASLQTYKIRSIDGTIYVNAPLLGGYSSLVVPIATDKTTVSGITSWPTMGVSPTLLNTRELSGTTSYFNKVELNLVDADRANVSFRVNGSNVLAGYFPSTKDYTLSMSDLFPDKDYRLKLNSIGVYGDTINIGSMAFGITDGRINVGGHLVPLKGAVIESIKKGGVYENTINGYTLADSPTSAPITFGGEWSLTVTGNTLKEVHPTHMEWSPGEFAFDKRDFAAVGLLVAGACLLGLGMIGQRSGIKIGVLLLICGGAALVYLTFV